MAQDRLERRSDPLPAESTQRGVGRRQGAVRPAYKKSIKIHENILEFIKNHDQIMKICQIL